jgi:hypothetical protein
MEEKTGTRSGISELLNLDHSKINALAEKHQNDPNGFINSLDSLFYKMCREMIEIRLLQKGGKLSMKYSAICRGKKMLTARVVKCRLRKWLFRDLEQLTTNV